MFLIKKQLHFINIKICGEENMRIFRTGFLFAMLLYPFLGQASEEIKANNEPSAPILNSLKQVKNVEKAPAKEELLKAQDDDNVLGNAKAKITVIEYSSLECGHCANFHKDAFKKIKADYIDKGLIKYIARDFPLSKVGVAGAKLAHCAPKEKYFDLLNSLFESQAVWAFNTKYLEALLNIAKLGGISEEKFKECQEDEQLQNFLLKRAMNASKILKIQSTPTFFIGDEVIFGEFPFSKFKLLIDSQLAK